jgi:hypothetical protein
MMDTIFSLLLIPFVLGFIILLNRAFQSPNDYKGKIIEALESKGYTLENITIPKLFDTGPFKRFPIQFSFVQTKVLGVSGEKTRYRIVKYKDKNGLMKKSWIEINIVAFIVTSIKWRPDL